MTGPQMHTATWRDLHHYLLSTGKSMRVVGRVDELGADLEWIASGGGLNRFGADGECTATWYPEGRDVLQVPTEIPAAPRHGAEVARAAQLLRQAADGRLECLANCPDGRARDVLETEAATLRLAADVVEGDLRPLYGWLPSWRWTDEMTKEKS